MAARGFRGVRDDLSEFGRYLLDIACFLTPLLPPPHRESPPPSPRLAPPMQKPRTSARALAGILSDLAEIGGCFRSGLSHISVAFRSSPDRDRRSSDHAGDARAIGVSQDVLEFIDYLVKRPESWLDFPVSVHDEFHMSLTQQEHVSIVECFAPDLSSLRLSLCPTHMSEESFWRIYFELLHPKLSKHDSELLSTHQILDPVCKMAKETNNRPTTRSQNLDPESLPSLTSEKCSNVQQEDNEEWQDALIINTGSQQSMDQWSEVTGAVDPSTDATKLGLDDISFRDTGEGNAFVMEYMDSLLAEEQQVHLPCSLRRKHVSAEENMANIEIPKSKMSSDEESDDWQADEDSDFEIVENSLVDKITENFLRGT